MVRKLSKRGVGIIQCLKWHSFMIHVCLLANCRLAGFWNSPNFKANLNVLQCAVWPPSISKWHQCQAAAPCCAPWHLAPHSCVSLSCRLSTHDSDSESARYTRQKIIRMSSDSFEITFIEAKQERQTIFMHCSIEWSGQLYKILPHRGTLHHGRHCPPCVAPPHNGRHNARHFPLLWIAAHGLWYLRLIFPSVILFVRLLLCSSSALHPMPSDDTLCQGLVSIASFSRLIQPDDTWQMKQRSFRN